MQRSGNVYPYKIDNTVSLVSTSQVEDDLASNNEDILPEPSPKLSMPVLLQNLPDQLLSPMSPNTFSQQYSETPDLAYLQLSNEEFARRNSLSLRDRTPPNGSIADEIINSDNASKHYSTAKSILSNIRQMSERFSDFATCESLSDDTDNEIIRLNNDGFRKQGRRPKRKKNKISPSPSKDHFLKKQNTNASPNTVGLDTNKS